MIFNETFYNNNQPANNILYIRQAGKLNCDKNYTISREKSPTNVIGYIKHGRLFLKIAEKDFVLSAGNSFLLLNNFKYTIYSDPKDPPEMFWCNVRGVLFDQITVAMSFNQYILSNAELDNFFTSIIHLIARYDDCRFAIFKQVFSTLCDIKQNEIICSGIVPELNKDLSNEIETYISNHIQSNFSVKEMSDEFKISVDTANRVFKAKYSLTPYQYYQKLRIDIAKNLLENSDMTIEDISHRLNYTDRNYFSLMFKKTTGYPPVSYRKK